MLYSGGVVEVVAPGSPTAGNAGGMNAGIAASQHTGPTVVSACADGTLHVWRWTSRTCERILPAHRGAVHAVTFLPPGRCVTAGEDATLRVWHVKSGTCTASLEGHMAPVRCVAALPCGTKVVSGADDRSVCVWDVASGTVLRTMEGHTAAVCACAPMAGPPRALAGSIDVDAPLAAALPIHSATSASSGAGGNAHNSGWIASRVVTASLDGSLRVWDTSSGRCEAVLALPPRRTGDGDGSFGSPLPKCVASLPDAIVLCGCDDGGVRLWRVPHWGSSVSSAAAAAAMAAMHLVGGGCGRNDDAQSSIASPPTSPSASSMSNYTPHSGPVGTTADGAYLIPCERRLRPGHEGACTAVCALTRGRIASGGTDGCVRLFTTRDFACVAVLTAGGGPHRSPITSITATWWEGAAFAVAAGHGFALWRETDLDGNARGGDGDGGAVMFSGHGATVVGVVHIESTPKAGSTAATSRWGLGQSSRPCGFDRLC